MNNKYLTVIDIGSYKISVCTALIEDNSTSIASYKEAPSNGVRRGKVLNPQNVSMVIRKLVSEIEQELGIKIKKIVTGIPGTGISNETYTLEIKRPNTYQFIDGAELENMIAQIKAARTKDKTTIYSIIPQSFRVDDAVGISSEEVKGMVGESLEGTYKLFIGGDNIFKMTETALKSAGLEIAGKFLYSEASAAASLTYHEKNNGVALIDFGGSTTDLIIYYKNIIRYTFTLPFGGNNITKDIAKECNITEELAESVKRDFGYVMSEHLGTYSEKSLHFKGGLERDREISVKHLSEIVNARCKEIFDAILYKIEESGYADKLSYGIVLTGGSANMPTIIDYIKSISGYNVRRATPSSRFDYSGYDQLLDFGATATIGLLIKSIENNVGMESEVIQPEPAPIDIKEPDKEQEPDHGHDTGTGNGQPHPDSKTKRGFFKKLLGGSSKEEKKGDQEKKDLKNIFFGNSDNV